MDEKAIKYITEASESYAEISAACLELADEMRYLNHTDEEERALMERCSSMIEKQSYVFVKMSEALEQIAFNNGRIDGDIDTHISFGQHYYEFGVSRFENLERHENLIQISRKEG